MGNRLRRNYFYHVIYSLSICLLPMVITPYIARVLGVENNGIYALSSTVATYFIMLGKLGFDHYGSRSIAYVRECRKKRSELFWSIYSLQFLTSLFILGIYVSSVSLFLKDRVYLMQSFYVASSLFDVSWLFYGMDEFRIATLRSLLARVLIIIGVFTFVSSDADLSLFTAIMSLAFLLEQLFLVPFVFRHVDWYGVNLKRSFQHIKPSLRLFIPILALSINNWTDKLMLGLIKGPTPVAFYNYAESVVNLPKGIVIAFGTVMLPAISNLAAKGLVNDHRYTLGRSVGIVAFISCALCFGIAGMAPVFIPWFLGPAYIPTGLLTVQLAIVMIPMSIVDVLQSQYLIPFKQESVYVRSVIVGAVINIILNILLIPLWGASGAVVGTIGATFAICSYQLVSIKNIFPIKSLIEKLVPFLVIGLAEFIAIVLVGSLQIMTPVLLLLQVGVGGIVYLLGCLIYCFYFNPDWINFTDWLGG